MSNAKSELGLLHLIVDVTNAELVKESLMQLLDCDNDITENEDYFQEDTLEKGYENEAERIVTERMEDIPVVDLASFIQVAENVSESISSQEFYGNTDISFIQLSDTTVSMVFVWGGRFTN